MAIRIADKLSEYWVSQRLRTRPGASRATVRQFETTHNVVLPADLRDYFLKHDGMDPYPPNDKDANGFTFWELGRVRPAAAELAEAVPPEESPPELDEYFAFADYLDSSWTYAIRLTANARDSSRVVMIGTADGVPLEIASSFGEFVHLYLHDSPRLYGQGSANNDAVG